MPDFTLYGITLTAIILGVVKLAQDEFELSDKAAGWARALLAGGAFLLVKNAVAIQMAWPHFETVVVQIGGFAATFLAVKGYWPEAQGIYRLAKHRVFKV